MNDRFNFQPTIKGKTLSLRPLVDADFDELFSCASDKLIWANHPHTDRYKLSEFKPYFKAAIDSKTCLVVIETSSGKIIGSTRFYLLDTIPDDISIGFTFLVREYWGGDANYQLKKLMLDYAFNTFTTVWFHIGPTNIRSQKAILKIGAIFSHEEVSNISGKDDSWFCYSITKEQWQNPIK